MSCHYTTMPSWHDLEICIYEIPIPAAGGRAGRLAPIRSIWAYFLILEWNEKAERLKTMSAHCSHGCVCSCVYNILEIAIEKQNSQIWLAWTQQREPSIWGVFALPNNYS